MKIIIINKLFIWHIYQRLTSVQMHITLKKIEKKNKKLQGHNSFTHKIIQFYTSSEISEKLRALLPYVPVFIRGICKIFLCSDLSVLLGVYGCSL